MGNSETSRINRKFERFLGLSSDQMCCRDYMSMEEQRRLAARDPPPIMVDNPGTKIGTFVYDFVNNTEEFIPSDNYKKKVDSK